jgi:uncharacterized membrane protein HdeD (DUF308 family)
MSSFNSALSDMPRAIRDALRFHWRLFLAQGVIMVILGVLAVIWPVVATLAVDLYVGWLFLISGLVGLAAMFWSEDVPAFVWTLLTAALSLAVGVLLLWKPIDGAISLTLVLTAFFVAEGVFQIASSLSYRNVVPDTWGWMLASGIADLLLAVIIVMGLPGTSNWALGLLAGVNLITSGWAVIMVAIAGRSAVETLVNARS